MNLLQKALQNNKVIFWLNNQNEETILNIRMLYAGYLQCPLCEITENLLEQEDLDFVWSIFKNQINKHDAGRQQDFN